MFDPTLGVAPVDALFKWIITTNSATAAGPSKNVTKLTDTQGRAIHLPFGHCIYIWRRALTLTPKLQLSVKHTTCHANIHVHRLGQFHISIPKKIVSEWAAGTGGGVMGRVACSARLGSGACGREGLTGDRWRRNP